MAYIPIELEWIAYHELKVGKFLARVYVNRDGAARLVITESGVEKHTETVTQGSPDHNFGNAQAKAQYRIAELIMADH